MKKNERKLLVKADSNFKKQKKLNIYDFKK
jgi:hypothetical protein